VEVLRQCELLKPAQLNELILADLQGRSAGPDALIRDLLGRGWLTPYQGDRLARGRAQELELGPYLVLERLGEGGAGEVFKARHRKMTRLAAGKVLRSHLLADAEMVRRFYREIEAVSRLQHPHLVHAYDAGPVGSTHFLAMEYLEGADLARLVKQSDPV